MFEIDLLKGKGRPAKSQPWAVALTTAPSLVPLIVVAFLVGGYATNGINVKTMEDQISKIDAKLADMSSARRDRDRARQQIESTARCTIDVATAIKNHMQWSDIIGEVTKNAAGHVVIYRLSASRNRAQVKTDSAGGQQNAYQFTLVIGAYAEVGDTGGASISKLISALNSSKLLGPRIETIKPTSTRNGVYQGRDVAVYDIECVFKVVQ